ncbi:DEAD/DEAH box helicase [Salinibaculum rarum]|uniref:DEAD/DEAH box helicase n=1 Tax=Salinibaculum rarum TaxID=3058903 RepID=UPI00265FEA73|nr:DEAD/DEAH box helicase [Salinibaculum sp. KK48]
MAAESSTTSQPESSSRELEYSDLAAKHIPEERKEVIEDLAATKGFPALTDTQEQAFMENILDGNDKLLVAQTGNGKTFIAETAAKQALERGDRVAYLVPSRQLVKEKRESINEWTSDDTAVAGPRDKYKDGDIIVKTFDSFFTALINNVQDAVNIDLAVFDDFHELYSDRRGPKIEQSLAMAMHRDITVFAMSATIGNPKDIARWFGADLTVSDETRCNPLDEQPIDLAGRNRTEVITRLIRDDDAGGGPYLIFNGTRPSSEKRAKHIARKGLFSVPREAADEYEAKVHAAADGELTEQQETLITCLRNGVAFHHAGLDTELKNFITEEYGDSDGHIHAIFCTPTLAYGFDSDVQTIIVSDLKRYNGEFMEPIGIFEYVQWIGRAAREGTGYDKGYIYPLYSDEDVRDRIQPEKAPREKELEPIETKMEDETVARKAFLQLINAGWDTTADLTEFLRKTLFWYYLTEDPQRVTNSAYTPVSDPETALADLRDDILEWLARTEFVEQRPATKSWDTTPLGDATVRFFGSVWFQTRVENLKLVWDAFTDEDDLEPEYVVEVIADAFGDRAVRKQSKIDDIVFNDRNNVEDWVDEMAVRGGRHSAPAVTAALLFGAWCRGVPKEVLSREYNTGKGALQSIAERHAAVLDGLEALFKRHPDVVKPDWLDGLHQQLDSGVRVEILAALDIPNVGRKRAHSLEKRVADFEQTQRALPDTSGDPWTRDGETLLADLASMVQKITADEGVRRADQELKKADGIGEGTAQRIIDYIREHDDAELTGRAPNGVDVEAVIGEKDGRSYTPDFDRASELEREGQRSLSDF